MFRKLRTLTLIVLAVLASCNPAFAQRKLSQINNGGALVPSTDQLVAVRSGTTDELVTMTGQVGSGTAGQPAFFTGTNSVSGVSNPYAITTISSGIMIDPRLYGATCAGATWSNGTPTEVGSADDTIGFELAEIASLNTGGYVLVPDGCWVANLQLYNGVTLQGGNWATNGGYAYGFGGFLPFMVLTPGSGYTNGTYPITVLNNPGSGSGFLPGANGGQYNFSMTSSTSLTIGTGSQTFTFTTTPGSAQFANNSWIMLVPTSATSDYEFGQVTNVSGTSVTYTVTQTAGSGTYNSWTVYVPPIVTVSGGALTSSFINPYDSGSGYANNTTIPIPTQAGVGTGGAITIPPIRVNGQPWNGPIMYTKGSPAYTVNWGGAQGVALMGFEIYGYGSGGTALLGAPTVEGGFGLKIYAFNMNFFGDTYNVYDPNAYDYLVMINDVFSGSSTAAIGGGFSDLYSEGNDYVSANLAWAGTGGGFMRSTNDRIEYTGGGLGGGEGGGYGAFEASLVNDQFDHISQCAITLVGGNNNVTVTGGNFRGSGLAGSFQVTGTGSGSGGVVRLTVNSDNTSCCGQSTVTGGVSNGQAITVTGVGGTTEANGNWTINVIDATHLDLVGTTYTHAYTSGGYAGVAGLDADICYEGTGVGTNIVQGVSLTGVQYNHALAVGGCCAPFSVEDMTTSGTYNDYINLTSGTAFPYGTANVQANYVAYTGQFSNFRVSTPAHYRQSSITGQPDINTDGALVVGLISATAGASIDFSGKIDSMLVPSGTTGQRPTCTAGMLRFNSTVPQFEVCNMTSGAWAGLGGVTWPASGDIVVSAGTSSSPTGIAVVNGDCIVGSGGAWGAGACSGSASSNLGTSISATSPQRSGQATTGLYTAASGHVDIAVTTTGEIADFNSGGENIIVPVLQLASANGLSFNSADTTVGGSLAVGSGALTGQTVSGSYSNTCGGYQACAGTMTTGATQLTAWGYQACGSVTSGGGNTCGGYQAGNGITSGTNNTIIGNGSGPINGSGGTGANTIVGTLAGNNLPNQNAFDVYIGEVAGRYSQGIQNTGVGFGALSEGSGSNGSGSSITAVGYEAASVMTTGNNITVIGANVASTTLKTGSNDILIGTSSAVDTPSAGSSNEINIANLLYYNIGSTAAPTVTSCGTSPAIDANANDRSGTVTVGTVAATSCTITFASAYTTWDHCRATPHSTIAAFGYTYSLSAITLSGTSLVGDVIDYDCDGY